VAGPGQVQVADPDRVPVLPVLVLPVLVLPVLVLPVAAVLRMVPAAQETLPAGATRAAGEPASRSVVAVTT
jgi:hypothetical protein